MRGGIQVNKEGKRYLKLKTNSILTTRSHNAERSFCILIINWTMMKEAAQKELKGCKPQV